MGFFRAFPHTPRFNILLGEVWLVGLVYFYFWSDCDVILDSVIVNMIKMRAIRPFAGQ